MDKLREEFEDAWIADNSSTPEEADIRREALKKIWYINEKGEGAYFDSFVMWAWKWWQASRASIVVEQCSSWVSCDVALPESKRGMWSKEVVALSNLGDVFKLSCMGDYWQRTSDFIDSGSSSVTHWISMPEESNTEK